MIKSWRREFSARGASAPDFPFGVVNLHSWCGEEEASCNPGTIFTIRLKSYQIINAKKYEIVKSYD